MLTRQHALRTQYVSSYFQSTPGELSFSHTLPPAFRGRVRELRSPQRSEAVAIEKELIADFPVFVELDWLEP